MLIDTGFETLFLINKFTKVAKKKYEELEAEIAELQAKIDAGIDPDAKEKIAALQSDLDAEKENSAKLQSDLDDEKENSAKLQSDLDAEKENSAKLQSDLDDAKEMAEDQASKLVELQAKLDTAGTVSEKQTTAAAVNNLDAVEHKGKVYKWAKPRFRILGDANIYTAEEAAANPELIDTVLAIEGQTILMEVVE